jgi:nanoRNase/pAp phosphatase (c-di-AMP/oligoRNAs hydrolase)
MRLVTRSDFDGLVCGMLLKEAGIIDNWVFVHPKDLQDGLFEATGDDLLANVPYVAGCGMWFDHHASEEERLHGAVDVPGESRPAPSAARIIYEYYGGVSRFPHFDALIEAVDRVDSGDLTADDILRPKGWVLMGFIMDPRTGLGRFRTFRISNYQLMAELIDHCRSMPIEEVLRHPDVRERVELYAEQTSEFMNMVSAHTTVVGNVILSDLRGVSPIYTGNRFLIYSMFPEANISLWIVDGRAGQNVAIACGHSILNRTSGTDVGALMLAHGGGGHPKVGTCQVPYEQADTAIAEIVQRLRDDG